MRSHLAVNQQLRISCLHPRCLKASFTAQREARCVTLQPCICSVDTASAGTLDSGHGPVSAQWVTNMHPGPRMPSAQSQPCCSELCNPRLPVPQPLHLPLRQTQRRCEDGAAETQQQPHPGTRVIQDYFTECHSVIISLLFNY